MAIVYDVANNKITVTGYSVGTPCNFTDIYNEDKLGTLSLHARTGISATDGAVVAVDRAERPADYIVLGGASNDLYITVANWNGTTTTIRITGTDRDGTAQTEDIVVNANGNYYTTKWFKTITHTQVTAFTATSFDYDLTQGQWGVVWKQGSDQFMFDTRIVLGNGSINTYLTDTSKQILITDFLAYGVAFMNIQNHAIATFGEIISETSKTCWKGCSFINLNTEGHTCTFYHNSNDADLYLYSCSLKNTGDGSSGNVKYAVQNNNLNNTCRVWDSVSDGGFVSGASDTYRLTHKKTSHGYYRPRGAIDDVLIYNNYRGAVVYSPVAETTFKNIICRDNNYSIRGYSIDENVYFIDCTMDNWNILWEGATNTHRFYRQYTFNLKAVDEGGTGIGGVNVKVTDNDGTEVVNADTASANEWWVIAGKTCSEHLEDVAPATPATTDDSDAWTISFRTNWDTSNGQYAYDAQSGRIIIGLISSTNGLYIGGVYYDKGLFIAGVHSYSVVSDGTNIQCYRDGVAIGTPVASGINIGGTKRWASRYSDSSPWKNNHNKACFHTDALTVAQVGTLHTQMAVVVNEIGTIDEQTETRGYYDEANGNTLQDKSPHTIVVSKAGCQTIKHKLTMDKIDWVKRLKRIAINADSEAML